jgi:3-hydroxyisobutyrate dehydrogenase
MICAVIGLGQMGHGIAANLDKSGLLRQAWDVVPEARSRMHLSDAATLSPPQDITADIVLFVVPSSREIASCLDALLARPHDGQILIDLTTSSPADTIILAAKAKAKGRIYLDGGMSGGARGADAGTLTLMMGGDPRGLERARPALNAIAREIFLLGEVGAGHTMKLVHNMVCHTNFLALSEACRMAERAGLSLPGVIDVINAGNARSFISERRFPDHIISGTFDGRSRVSNLAKDLGMAAELAEHLEQDAPYTNLTTTLLKRAMETGHADEDFTELYRYYEALAGWQGE